MLRALIVLAALLMLAGCGTYRKYAERECAAKGLTTGAAPDAECVRGIERMLQRNRFLSERYGGSGAAAAIGR